MKIIHKDQTKIFKNSDVCTAFEYPLGDKDINGAIIELKGRYPDKGRVVNLKCKELAYIIEGSGMAVVEEKEVKLENGDLILESHKRKAIGKFTDIKTNEGGKMFYREKSALIPNAHYEKIEKGYTDCGCNAGFEGGIVLDPFAGTSTTCLMAQKLGRKFIGIELSPEYVAMSEKRLAQKVLL